jgi:nitrate reductase delta subunit
MGAETYQPVFLHFAELLEYPRGNLRHSAHACAQELTSTCPQARELLNGFTLEAEQSSPARMEEIYTSTFDLQGQCCTYVGHQLFGESYKRSWFMARLNEAYRTEGFNGGNDLPDHVATVLRFLAQGGMDEFKRVLVMEGLIPAVEKMIQAFDQADDHPYRRVLQALRLYLEGTKITEPLGEMNLETGGLSHV